MLIDRLSEKIGSSVRNNPKRYVTGVILFICLIAYYYCLPDPLFNDPVSTVIVDRENKLLGARIATDEQWRFPVNPNVPSWFEKSIVCFEDKRFYNHPGIDPLALARATFLNIRHWGVKSGGSTLSMQVIRLSRKGKSRTIFEKLVEMILATRLELRYSKKEILALYAAHAPFGGNIVGLETASWKYYERSAKLLSLSEMATLAVLPNAPGLIHPNKNRDRLKQKRDRLLDSMYEESMIDSLSWVLAKVEPLPDRAKPLPSIAPHLLQRVIDERGDQRVESITTTSLSFNLQSQVNAIAVRHHERLSQNGIHNLAALVIDIKSGNVLAYVGNTPFKKGKHGFAVDIIRSRRSSGSIFKPFLYADLFSNGEILPKALVPDFPSYYSGYTPKNFDYTYAGAVPANEALYRSLNVPAIRLLSEFGIQKFHSTLKKVGMTTLDHPAIHYGLSLAVGGAECSLWDIGSAYAGMARTLNDYSANAYKYAADAYRPLNFYLQNEHTKRPELSNYAPLSAGAIWQIMEAMTEVKRPGAESYWRAFSSSGRIAWKTGTSYGFRDAWAGGCTPDYVVAVWCGNADGEGRPGLVGVSAAAPFMFDIFNALGITQRWFDKPFHDLIEIEICKKSGFKAGRHCHGMYTDWVTAGSERSRICPYHKTILLDETEGWRVHDNCESPQNMISKSFFILPPVMEKYFKVRNPDYHILPSYRKDCQENLSEENNHRSMQLVYPNMTSTFSIPIQLDETKSSVVFEASHRSSEATIYWHLDEYYIGKTTHFHEFALTPETGKHILTLVDDMGEVITVPFQIIE